MNSQQSREVVILKSRSTLTSRLKSVLKYAKYSSHKKKSTVPKSSKRRLLEQVAIVRTNLKEDIVETLEMCPNS